MKVSIPDRIPARFLEAAQYGVSGLYVLQLHLAIELDGRLSVERLKRALRLCLDREPVLGCRFVPAWSRAHWARLAPEALDEAPLLREADGDPAGREAAEAAFLAESLAGDEGPQLRALLLHGTEGDRLVVKVNHQVVDAGGTKELGYLIADTYCRLGEDPGLRPEPNLGSRSLLQVYGRLTRREQLRALSHYPRELARLRFPTQGLCFPSGIEKQGDYRFVIKRFHKDRVCAMAAYGRARGGTLNDLFVTALFRALAEEARWDGQSVLRMICTVDLRRYLPERRAAALCNLSGFFQPNLGRDLGRDFDETLGRVQRDIDACERNSFGLAAILGEWVISRPLPFATHRRVQAMIVRKLGSAGDLAPAFTNLGPIEKGALAFGTPEVLRAEVLVPPTCPPFFCPGLSGFDGTLTLSAGFYPSAVPVDRVERFFDLVDEQLPTHA